MEEIEQRWHDFFGKAATRGNPTLYFGIIDMQHMSPPRAYHNLDGHVLDCLREFDDAEDISANPNLVKLTFWTHDAIYHPERSDNEELSARFAQFIAREIGMDGENVDQVYWLVMNTKKHNPCSHPDYQLVADIDLAILGRPQDEFDDYERKIREEYRDVSPELFAKGRKDILKGILSREPIYQTLHFRRKYEDSARANLERTIASLSEP